MEKLILVEGLPGSGKSTTAQWLYHSFCQSEIPSQWFYELSGNHPLSYSSDIDKISKKLILKESVDLWEAFAQSTIDDSKVTIIDSGFFQKNILRMMSMNINRNDIHNYALQVEVMIGKYDAHFIYLNSGDAETHMLKAYKKRGRRFQDALVQWSNSMEYSVCNGYMKVSGSLAFWRDYKELCDSIYRKFRLNKIEIDVAKEVWPEHYTTLSRLLGIKGYDNVNNSSAFHGKLSGDYVMRDSDFAVNIKERLGSFSITNLLHPLESESLMMPNGSNDFFIRGHDVSLRFGEFRRGLPEVMEVSSSWNKVNGRVFDRIGQ